MFSKHNKTKLSIFVLNLVIFNVLSIQPALALNSGSEYMTVVSDNVPTGSASATITALTAISGGTEVFADFATAGVTKAVTGNKAGYDTAISSARKTKGSSLTLAEVQTQVGNVNAAAAAAATAAAAAALTAINGGTEVFTDFATAGVTKAITGNKADYNSAIASAIKTIGSKLTLAEVQTQVGNVNAAVAAAALTTINGGTEVFADFATAGVTKAVVGNKAGYDTAIASAIKTKSSSLTLAEVQTQVENANTVVSNAALASINGGTEVFADFSTAGITKAIAGNNAGYDTAIASAIKTKSSNLTLAEVQTQVESVNVVAATTSLNAINEGTEVFADFSTAGVTKAVTGNNAGYDTAIASAIKTKGSDLTLAEVQTQVENVNDATVTAALTAINSGTDVFSDFATAGVTKAVVRIKLGYDYAIASAVKANKGSDLTLAEVQTQVEAVNALAATTALTAINSGTEVFADFATAGITKASLKAKAGYDTSIATAITTKGSDLTLAEVQAQVESVNAAIAATALRAINGRKELFIDFATAGVTGAAVRKISYYDTTIATAIKTKGSDLTLAEVQSQVGSVNAVATTTALTAINGGQDVFADFATAGVTGAVKKRKIDYDTAIAAAIKTKGFCLTLAEMQTLVGGINAAAATTAIMAINGGQDVFADFATAGVTGALVNRKIDYDTAIATAITTKGSRLTLAEVQSQVSIVNGTAATTALAAINGGIDVFADFATAGVTEANLKSKIDYDAAIATANEIKDSDLTLKEVQTQVTSVNTAAAAAALAAINAGTDVFADFATAGVKEAVINNKLDYDTAIATATITKGSDLTLAEVQAQVSGVNRVARQ